MEEFKKQGITFIKASEQDVQYYMNAGNRARKELVGKNYSQEFLTRVETALTTYRKTNSGKNGR